MGLGFQRQYGFNRAHFKEIRAFGIDRCELVFYAYDKVIMLAGGVGFASKRDALKGHPSAGEKVIVMGRICCRNRMRRWML